MTTDPTPTEAKRTRFSLTDHLNWLGYDPDKVRGVLTGIEWAALPSLFREDLRIKAEKAKTEAALNALQKDLGPILNKLGAAIKAEWRGP